MNIVTALHDNIIVAMMAPGASKTPRATTPEALRKTSCRDRVTSTSRLTQSLYPAERLVPWKVYTRA